MLYLFILSTKSLLHAYISIFLNAIQYIPNCVHIYDTHTIYSIHSFFITRIVFLCVFTLLPQFSTFFKISFLSHFQTDIHRKKPV